MRELDGDDSRLREARIENTIRSVVDQVRKACFGSPVREDQSFSLNRLPVPSLPENLVDERCIPLSPNRNGAAAVPRDSRPLTSSPVFFGDMELPFATTDLHQPPLVDTGLTQLSPMALPGLMQPPSSSRIDSLPASVLGSPFSSVSGFASMKDQSNDIMLCYNGDLPSAANVDMLSLMHAGLMGDSNTVRPMDSNLHSLTCNELYSFTRPNLVQLTGENGHQGFSKILNSLEIPNSYSLVVPASNSSELNDPSVSEENNNLSPLRTYITPTLLSVNGQEQQSSVVAPESPLSHQHSLSRPASVAPASRDLPTCGNNISLLIVGPSSAANFRCGNDKQGNSTVAPSRKRKRSHSTSATDAEDNSYIDTKELCERISYELRSHTISQATFAARVLNRSQGTLSDLLRNPKPWNVLKSGRETFRRMYNWLQLPLVARMQMFDSSSSSSEENQNDVTTTTTSSSASNKEPTSPTKAKAAGSGERQCRVSSTFVSEEDLADARARLTKKRRLVFSESQKKALNAVFRVKPRPSRRIQEVVARCLDLSRSTVQNFFMNARRRSRPNGQLIDQPLSHQVVRPISPPPPLPKGPVREPSTRRQGNNSSNNISSSNTGTATAGGHSTDEAATTDDEFDPLVLLVLEMVRSEEDRLAGENPLSTATSAAASPLNDSA